MKRNRLLMISVLLLLGIGISQSPTLRALASVEGLRSLTEGAGAWGLLAFFLTFAISALFGVPALAFIFAALISYGTGAGLVVAFVGALLAASASFFGVRLLRGNRIEKPAAEESANKALPARILRRGLRALDEKPVLVVAALRALFFLSGPLNLALALSRVRYRQYIVGTALGVVPPLLFYSLTLGCLFS